MEFLLEVEDAFLLQLTDDLLPLAGHVAQSIGGVDVADNPGETVGLVELGIDPQQHLHARREPLAGGAFEVGADEHPLRGPALGRGFGYRRGCTLVLLDEFHVAMPPRLAAFRQFCLYPVLFGHPALYHLAYEAVEFQQRQSVFSTHGR